MSSVQARDEFDVIGKHYNTIEDLPWNSLERALIEAGRGDCHGFKILDLAGGTGLKARKALDNGAAGVDVVDISGGMIDAVSASQKRYGEAIRGFVADCSKPLATQDSTSGLIPGSYDMVMANWLFSYADSMAVLRGMWENIVTYLKPGGKFVGVRAVGNRNAGYTKVGKYGEFKFNLEKIPGGCRYRIRLMMEPPIEFDCADMNDTMMLVDTIPRELGLTDFKVVKPEDTKLVQEDLGFWEDFVSEPSFLVVTANKPL